MNASVRLFARGDRLRLAASAGVCAMTAACATLPTQEVAMDPAARLEPEMALASQANHAYPTFGDIPQVPSDLPAPARYGQSASEVTLALARLDAATAPDTWTLSDSEAFAAAERSRLDALEAPGAADAAATEAFARRLRERATPPPLPR